MDKSLSNLYTLITGAFVAFMLTVGLTRFGVSQSWAIVIAVAATLPLTLCVLSLNQDADDLIADNEEFK